MYPQYSNFGYETKCKEEPIAFPPQHQEKQPGIESVMVPRPIFNNPNYLGSGKLKNKVALITGGDSGIGRAISIAFAKEGADIAIVYLYEDEDALETKSAVEELGHKCLLIKGDIRNANFCNKAVDDTIKEYGHLDVLINNAAIQIYQESILDISEEQLENTFKTNIYPAFYFAKASLPYLSNGSSIINTASIVAYEGFKTLIDYAATKGALVSFTRSLALSLVDKGIRVNAVAPGSVWTPLTVSSFPADIVKNFGIDNPMKRAAQPFELAPTYVYLASDDSRYVTGETLHVNGGKMRTS